MAKKDFNEFRFAGLDFKSASNKYWTMKRVNADESKIVVKVDESMLQPTRYGYALILDDKHVVFAKHDASGETVGLTDVDIHNIKNNIAVALIQGEIRPILLCEY